MKFKQILNLYKIRHISLKEHIISPKDHQVPPVLDALSDTVADVPKPIAPLPLPKQVKWQQMEKLAFVHFGLNTFDNKEWGYGDGLWQTVDASEETTTIGYKRILRFPTITARRLRVRFINARACLCISHVAAFHTEYSLQGTI